MLFAWVFFIGICGYFYGYLLLLWVFMGNFMGMVDSNTIVITPEMLSLIGEIDEFKGTWKAIGNIVPEKLLQLQKVATIESIGSSTRIEGSKLSDKEVEILLSNLQIKNFSNRDEQEVAGYASVMNTIFQHYADIPLTENYIKQLHRDLLQFSVKDDWHRGDYKKSSNQVEAFDETGKSIGVVFETSTPFETPMRMQELVVWSKKMIEEKKLHPLLVAAIFIVEFLAIHPFQDGNGRLSRILHTYLLLITGYVYVPYSSLEAVIEQNKQGYYLALRQTQATLKSATPNWESWVIFFLKALQTQKNRLAEKIQREHILLGKLPELSQKILELTKSKVKITIGEIQTLTNANRNTIKKHLENLVAMKRLVKNGIGRGSWYEIA